MIYGFFKKLSLSLSPWEWKSDERLKSVPSARSHYGSVDNAPQTPDAVGDAEASQLSICAAGPRSVAGPGTGPGVTGGSGGTDPGSLPAAVPARGGGQRTRPRVRARHSRSSLGSRRACVSPSRHRGRREEAALGGLSGVRSQPRLVSPAAPGPSCQPSVTSPAAQERSPLPASYSSSSATNGLHSDPSPSFPPPERCDSRRG